jgi:hypothetical protein
MSLFRCLLSLGLLPLGFTGCVGGSAADLPMIVPPVRAATPAGLAAASPASPANAEAPLSATEFRDRFFNPAGGPTDVFRILADIDGRITEVNDAALDQPRGCLDATPTTYDLVAFGQHVPFAAQCYRTFAGASGPPAFMQFGKLDGLTYLYVTGGATRVAARIAPGRDGQPVVDVWYGVGLTNDTCSSDGSFDGCSYAVTQIHASPEAHAFEMSVAGIGVGFCGIQVWSDGTTIFGSGSADMGATCRAAANLCVSARDLASPGDCDEPPVFSVPALGRKAGAGGRAFGASRYPDEPNIKLDGTAADSVHFGPGEAPTPGVAAFDP